MNNRSKGFTLIEILIAVVIIGILAGFALPQYGAYLRESRRLDAHVALRAAAQELERCRTQDFSYAACAINTTTSDEGHYTIAASGLTANAYLLTATADANGAQAGDVGCTAMTLNAQGITGPAAGDCW